ncbi:epoxide hydrolase N-terminal domain-containing protein [Pseudomonas fluorescens]|uniref:epoxide hydrolase N-terminal domain-containing protein n=2 Tax=Pseudomonas TaxID=286 RepID=UPI002091DA24|nr:epoxide hydrolase N-terminal domain-containing protein [Pseudomonas fluorescens]
MPAATFGFTWRHCLASSVRMGALGLALIASSGGAWAAGPAADASVASSASTHPESIRPYRIHVDEAQLTDLKKRIAATCWPDKETVNDVSQGVQLAQVQALVKYWGSGYDWRKAEAKLNALPEFITTIDGVDIQFIHVRSPNSNAMPLLLTHGWPGSQFEFLKTIGPLTDPVAYGGKVEDSFDVIIPSIPGHGFSGKPTEFELMDDCGDKDKLWNDLGEMEHLVREGVAYARSVHGATEESRRTDLDSFLDSLVFDYQDMGKDVQLSGKSNAVIHTRPHALRRVLVNLTDNALKFAGAAQLRVEPEEGDSLSVTVMDRGPGIAEEELARVIEPFYRVENSRNRSTGGTGLGLAIAQQLAQALGGTLTLRNREGGGLCAELRLPTRFS